MHPPIRIRILASGSQGNAAIVSLRPRDAAPMHVLLDLGLSPRKLCGALAVENIHPLDIAAILITHADADHLHGGWSRNWPFQHAKVIARSAHHGAMVRAGIPATRTLNADPDADSKHFSRTFTALLCRMTLRVQLDFVFQPMAWRWAGPPTWDECRTMPWHFSRAWTRCVLKATTTCNCNSAHRVRTF